MIKVLNIFLFFSYFLLIMPKAYSQIHPHWFDEVQIFQLGIGYLINHRPILDEVDFTGQGWGVAPLSWWDLTTIKSEIDAWHKRGKVYAAASSVIRLTNPTITAIPDSHRAIDLNGNYITDPSGARYYTLCSPIWQQFIIDRVKAAIDAGADVFHFDDTGFHGLMASYNERPGTFDPITMAVFRDYLASKYSNKELQDNFDISDIGSFNFGEWIKANGFENRWNKPPFHPLTTEYFLFLVKQENDFFDKLVSVTRQYSKEVYGREIAFSVNSIWVWDYYLFDKIDYVLAEHGTFGEETSFANIPIRTMKSIKNWPVFIVPEITKPALPRSTKNLIKLILADIYASGGRIGFGEYLSDPFGLLGIIEIDIKFLRIYTNFILSHNTLYERLSYLKQVTLLNSHASNLDNIWPTEVDLGTRRPSFFGGGRMLTDSNVQFDCVFAPYKMFTTFPDFTYEQLTKYNVVVLPSTFKLSDEQAQTILNYIESGGVVVAWREVGTHYPDGTPANRPELLSLQQGDGVKSYGAGKFIYSTLDLGTAYVQDWGISHDEIRRRFQDMILPYIKPLIKTENVSEVYRPGGATGFLYQDPHGNYILHLVNYDYNEFTDEFAVKENFTLKILADTTKAWQAVYVSPDFLGQQVLPTTNDSGYVTMTIPKLEAYGIVILQENQTAPHITSRTPLNDVTILAGDSLRFNIQAQDPDNNPLFYQWYVNGQVDSFATDSTYLYRTIHTDTGVDTISVEVSDGSHKVTSQWQVTLQPYVFPKILFDENHRQKMSTIWSRANKLAPGDPEQRSYQKMVERLSKDYIVISDTSGTLTSDNLQDINVLIFAASDDDISSNERLMIQQFVREGGNALFLGDPHWWWAYKESNGNLFRLLQDFGFKTYLPPVRSLDDTLYSSHLYMIDLKGTHPATLEVGRIQLEWVHKLETITDYAEIIETTGNLRVWEDINDNGAKDSNEPLQSNVGFVGVSEYENGRVIYISFFRFHDREIQKNYRLIASVLKWLTADVNPVVSVGEKGEGISIPKSFDISQNYPNPFNPTTTIRFQLPKHSKVTIKIYDILGREVRTLVNKDFERGWHRVTWDGSNNKGRKVASGVYFYRMEAEEFVKVRKALFLK